METQKTDKSYAIGLDVADPLKKYKQKFHLPKGISEQDCIYFCGNSLGLQPKSVQLYIELVLTSWATSGVEGHFKGKHSWLRYTEKLSEQTARLVGADPIEVVVMNTLTVNLHLMMVSFYRPTPIRHKILIEYSTFPSDLYAIKSQIKFHGFDPETSLVKLMPRQGESTLLTKDIEALIDREGESIALILLGGVNYYSGQSFDMERITRIGHKKGCTVGFDLAHAVGNIILNLHDWNVDFAVWCTYKYLNAGPGSLAGCFIHDCFKERYDLPRFAGWWGQNIQNRFLMGPEFKPVSGAEGWQISNPPILAIAPLLASMEIFNEIGMEALRAKSVKLTGYLEFLINNYCDDNLSIITPSDENQRGCQLSINVKKNGKSLFEKLTANDVICDWREPSVIRVAPVPIYNSYLEVYNFVQILKRENDKISKYS